MNPIYFTNTQELRKWFEENHQTAGELWVGYYKKGSGKKSITWSESVDQALCFGWIDGLSKSIDEHRFTIRFTKRKPKSIWSAVNINKVEQLTKQGLMQPAGIAAFSQRQENNSKIYSFEQEVVQLPEHYQTKFEEQPQAWTFFQAQAPSYKKAALWWVISAKQEQTREKRLEQLIQESLVGKRLAQFSRPSKKA